MNTSRILAAIKLRWKKNRATRAERLNIQRRFLLPAFAVATLAAAPGAWTSAEAGGSSPPFSRSLVREKLSTDRTYYVSLSGSDLNNGLSNTSTGAYRTVQKALDIAFDTLDLCGHTITIQVADGDYSQVATQAYRDRPNVGGGRIQIIGNLTTPANVILAGTGSGSCAIQMYYGALVYVAGVKVSANARGLYAAFGGGIIFDKLEFGTCGDYQLRASGGYVWNSAFLGGSPGYKISGGAGCHCAGHVGGTIYCATSTITIVNTPAFPNGFATWATGGSLEYGVATISGATTGPRFNAYAGGSASVPYPYSDTFFPGDTAGIVQIGGVSPAGVTNTQGGSLWNGLHAAAVNTDSVITLDISAASGILLVTINSINGARSQVPCGQFRCRSPGAFIENVSLDLTSVNLTTGALTGTTGTPGKFTIAVAEDKKIYFENRTGQTRYITTQLMY